MPPLVVFLAATAVGGVFVAQTAACVAPGAKEVARIAAVRLLESEGGSFLGAGGFLGGLLFFGGDFFAMTGL